MNPFKAFKRWLNRKNKPNVHPITANFTIKPQIIEGEKANIIGCIIENKPHLVIVQDGDRVVSTIHGLSKEALVVAIKGFADNIEFKDLLTDIVIDINTQKK